LCTCGCVLVVVYLYSVCSFLSVLFTFLTFFHLFPSIYFPPCVSFCVSFGVAYIGTLVHWYIGTLVHWYMGTWVHGYIGAVLCVPLLERCGQGLRSTFTRCKKSWTKQKAPFVGRCEKTTTDWCMRFYVSPRTTKRRHCHPHRC